jgi:hypothetical protein
MGANGGLLTHQPKQSQNFGRRAPPQPPAASPKCRWRTGRTLPDAVLVETRSGPRPVRGRGPLLVAEPSAGLETTFLMVSYRAPGSSVDNLWIPTVSRRPWRRWWVSATDPPGGRARLHPSGTVVSGGYKAAPPALIHQPAATRASGSGGSPTSPWPWSTPSFSCSVNGERQNAGQSAGAAMDKPYVWNLHCRSSELHRMGGVSPWTKSVGT